MRIAFLCKRRYMNKDVIADRYARLYEIPRHLALQGHQVLGLCASYGPAKAIDLEDPTAESRLRWLAAATGRLRVPQLLAYPAFAISALRRFRPDVLIGASDAVHVVLARKLAGKLGVPYSVDLYDNFESFGLTKLPGLLCAYRRAITEAVTVSCTSNALVEYVREKCRPHGDVFALPSTVDLSIFTRGDKSAARAELNLPATAKLIGTAGGLYADKGIGSVYDAFLSLAAKRDDVHLVLAGPIDRRCSPPAHARVHYLGALAHAKIATLFQALDVGIVYLRDTPFGRYCFPQKAYEMLACGLPLTAAAVGEMTHLLSTASQSLYEPDNSESLEVSLGHQLSRPQVPNINIDDWRNMVRILSKAIETCVTADKVR